MADDSLSCVFCDWITNHVTEEDIEAQRRELERYNAVRDSEVVLSPRPPRRLPNPPSYDDASSMHTASDSSRSSPSAPSFERREDSDISAKLIASMREEIQDERLRSLYWQHQFTQDHAKHARAWSENKRLESRLITANEKLDNAETRIGELEAELVTRDTASQSPSGHDRV